MILTRYIVSMHLHRGRLSCMESAILATIPTNRLAKGLGGLFFNDACVEGHHVIKRKLTEAVDFVTLRKLPQPSQIVKLYSTGCNGNVFRNSFRHLQDELFRATKSCGQDSRYSTPGVA